MNTSCSTAGDPAARHAIHPTIRRYLDMSRLGDNLVEAN